MAGIDGLLQIMAERGSSDLHIRAGNSPAIRLAGRLIVLTEFASLTAGLEVRWETIEVDGSSQFYVLRKPERNQATD